MEKNECPEEFLERMRDRNEQRKLMKLITAFSSDEELKEWLMQGSNLEEFCSIVNTKGNKKTRDYFLKNFGEDLSKKHPAKCEQANDEKLYKLKIPTEPDRKL